MKIGGKYNWKNQKDQLIYIGCHQAWHQFHKVGDERRVWCEVLSCDLHKIEETVQGETETLRDHLCFVERWANHHGQKPHVTAQEALGVIQHYPPISKITKSYADGKLPETRNPYAELEAEQAKVRMLRETLTDVTQTLCWRVFGECRNITDRPLLTANQAEAVARVTLSLTKPVASCSLT